MDAPEEGGRLFEEGSNGTRKPFLHNISMVIGVAFLSILLLSELETTPKMGTILDLA